MPPPPLPLRPLCGCERSRTRSAPRRACFADGRVRCRAARPSRLASGGRAHAGVPYRSADCDRVAFGWSTTAAARLTRQTRADRWPVVCRRRPARPRRRRAAGATAVARWRSDAGTADWRCWSHWIRPSVAAWSSCGGIDVGRQRWIFGIAGWTAALRSWWTGGASGGLVPVRWSNRRPFAGWPDWALIRCARRAAGLWAIWAVCPIWSCVVCCGWQ